jgi:hypothetical protein
MSECATAAIVDAWPQRATLRVVAGDPFSFRLQLRGPDGDLIDVSGWEWAGSVYAGRVRLDFETATEETGPAVLVWMRGDVTAQIPVGKAWPFDVACRQPAAGEGVTVLAGDLFAKSRVTDPIRSDPDAAPREEVPV